MAFDAPADAPPSDAGMAGPDGASTDSRPDAGATDGLPDGKQDAILEAGQDFTPGDGGAPGE